MKVFVINLKKNTDRMAKIAGRLRELEVNYERQDAIYGKDMSEAEKRKMVSRFKWWCARGTLPRNGEIGCALSHMAVYKKLIVSGEPCCCVLEDDDELKDGFKEQLVRVEKWIDAKRPQVVLLTNYTKEIDDGTFRIVPSVGDSSAEGYVITAIAARKIVERFYPVCMPSDSWRYWVKRGCIELYHAFPTVIPSTWRNEGYVSDVCPKGEQKIDASKFSVLMLLCWRLFRLIGTFIGWIII